MYFLEELAVKVAEHLTCTLWPSALITSMLGLQGKLLFTSKKKKTLKSVYGIKGFPNRKLSISAEKLYFLRE